MRRCRGYRGVGDVYGEWEIDEGGYGEEGEKKILKIFFFFPGNACIYAPGVPLEKKNRDADAVDPDLNLPDRADAPVLRVPDMVGRSSATWASVSGRFMLETGADVRR